MSESIPTGPPPETTAYVPPASSALYYPPPPPTQADSSPPMIPTPGGSPKAENPVSHPPYSTPWPETLPGHQGDLYSRGGGPSPAYPPVYAPHPHQPPPHEWYPPPGPQLRPGQIIVNKEQYDADLQEIDTLRRKIRDLKTDLHREQDEHDDKLHKLRRELQAEYRDKLDDQQREMRELEQLVDDLRQQVQDATKNIRAEAPPETPPAIPERQREPMRVAQPPLYQPIREVNSFPVPNEDFAECPMECGFIGCSDLLQAHMLESHPELFGDDVPAQTNYNGNGNVGGGLSQPARQNLPPPQGSPAAKNKTITLVLPGNSQHEIQIAEDATLQEFNEKLQQATGRERHRVNLVVGGRMLNPQAPLQDRWLSAIPQNCRHLDSIFMMCQFRV